jgi:hypothetical protein
MKKIIAIATLVAATSASAGFFNNSNGSNNWVHYAIIHQK